MFGSDTAIYGLRQAPEPRPPPRPAEIRSEAIWELLWGAYRSHRLEPWHVAISSALEAGLTGPSLARALTSAPHEFQLAAAPIVHHFRAPTVWMSLAAGSAPPPSMELARWLTTLSSPQALESEAAAALGEASSWLRLDYLDRLADIAAGRVVIPPGPHGLRVSPCGRLFRLSDGISECAFINAPGGQYELHCGRRPDGRIMAAAIVPRSMSA